MIDGFAPDPGWPHMSLAEIEARLNESGIVDDNGIIVVAAIDGSGQVVREVERRLLPGGDLDLQIESFDPSGSVARASTMKSWRRR